MSSNYHPETRVNFAATEAFTRHWGNEEARKQQKEFERPSWTTVTRSPSPEGKPAKLPDLPNNAIAVYAVLFLAGLAIGGYLAWSQAKN